MTPSFFRCLLVALVLMPSTAYSDLTVNLFRDRILSSLQSCQVNECAGALRGVLTEPNLHSTERLGILDEAANVIIESSTTSVTGALDLRKIETLLKLTASDLSVDQGEKQDFLGNPMPAVTEDDLQAWRSGLLSKIAKANDRLGLPALASEQFRRVIGMLEEQGKLN